MNFEIELRWKKTHRYFSFGKLFWKKIEGPLQVMLRLLVQGSGGGNQATLALGLVPLLVAWVPPGRFFLCGP